MYGRLYRKFCQNFANIASSLTNLLNKKAKFVWSDYCQKAFDHVKAVLTHAPVLMASDFDKPFTIDASDIGVGGVLVQGVAGCRVEEGIISP